MTQRTHPLEELDLSISNMESPDDEGRAGEVLEGIRGIEVVRFVGQGAWIAYDPARTGKDQICDALHKAGFDAKTFQDSLTGEEGSANA